MSCPLAFHVARLLALALLAWGWQAAQAAVPNAKAEPAYAEEQTILHLEQGLPEPGLADAASGRRHFDRHFIVPPGRMPEQDVILQRGGNTWRVLHNGPLAIAGAALLLGMLLILVVAHRLLGPSRQDADAPDSDTAILRFTRRQRVVHWTTAITFIVLAVTGLVMLYGKNLLLPWMGHTAFSWLAVVGKYVHNVAGPLFVLATVLMFVTYVRHNRFAREDWTWLKRLGGLFSKQHVPAGYFNAGEKLWFWGAVTGLGLLMGVTGLMLDFPYLGEVGHAIGLTRYQLQWANGLHLLGGALYMAGTLGHIYLGTLGSPGAWSAMRHGTVAERWACTHHRLWYDEVKRRAR